MTEKSSSATNVLCEKWIGKPARACQRCGCGFFHVNRLGGLVCSSCNPPRTESDNQLQLMAITVGGVISGGGRSDADRIPWGCWSERAIIAVAEARAHERAGTNPGGEPERIEGGRTIWADAEQELEYQRLAAEKGEPLDEFRERKMNSFFDL